MAEASKYPATDVQLINVGLIIIKNSNMFGSDIRKWNSRPAVEKNRKNFKYHFTISQQEINKSQTQQTVGDLGFHQQSNAITLADKLYARFYANQADEAPQANAIEAEHKSDMALHEKIEQMANYTQKNSSVLSQMSALTDIIRNLENCMN